MLRTEISQLPFSPVNRFARRRNVAKIQPSENSKPVSFGSGVCGPCHAHLALATRVPGSSHCTSIPFAGSSHWCSTPLPRPCSTTIDRLVAVTKARQISYSPGTEDGSGNSFNASNWAELSTIFLLGRSGWSGGRSSVRMMKLSSWAAKRPTSCLRSDHSRVPSTVPLATSNNTTCTRTGENEASLSGV